MCPRAFTADTNDYILVTSLMYDKYVHRYARITLSHQFITFVHQNVKK